MLRCREDGPVLSVVYRPTVLGIVGAGLFVVGVVLLLIGMAQPHEATLRCKGPECTLERVGVLSSERVEIRGLHRADTTPQELVLRADTDVVMGPWVARRGVPSYREAETKINAFIAAGRSGALEATVPVRGTLRWLGFGAVAILLGIALGVVFAIGARAVLDRKRDEVRRFGSRLRAKLTDVTAIDVRGNQIIATLREGRPIAIVSALGKPGDLEPTAARIRRFVLS